MTKLTIIAVSAAALVAGMVAASAADDHAHAAKHGGQFVEVEGHHGVEMVATADALIFHVTDEDKPMDLMGAQFKAVVQTDAGTTSVALSVEGGALKGALKAPLPAGAKIVISGKDRHGHALQARFVKQ
jgi:opacity protein-like surface antigen